jgi:hypothetical protein
LDTEPEVPCTAVGRTVRDVGERFSASIAPGGGARAASTAGMPREPAWAEDAGSAETLATPITSKTLARLTVRRDGPRIHTSRIDAPFCLTWRKAACCAQLLLTRLDECPG